MEFTCTMLITSQCFSTYFFMAVVVRDNLILSSIYIAAFTPSFGSNCFYLDTLSGKLKHYLYMFVLMSKVRKLMFLFCFFNQSFFSSGGGFFYFHGPPLLHEQRKHCSPDFTHLCCLNSFHSQKHLWFHFTS